MPNWFSKLFKKKGRSTDSVEEECPLKKKGSICVAVSDADTDAPIGGVSITVSGPQTQTKPTTPQGVAEFIDLTLGAYEVSVTPPQNLSSYNYNDDKRFEARVVGGVFLGADDNFAMVEVFAYPAGTPKVKVAKKGDAPVPISGATVSIEGPRGALSATTQGGTGIADFGPRKPGRYSVKGVTLGSEDQKDYQLANDLTQNPVEFNVAEGQVGQGEVEVVELPNATLQIKVKRSDIQAGVANVPVSLSGKASKQANTNGEGVPEFGRLLPGTYDIQIDALEEHKPLRLPDGTPFTSISQRGIVLSSRETKTIERLVYRPVKLQVKMVQKGSSEIFFGDATIELSRQETTVTKTTLSNTGMAEFTDLEPGTYELKAALKTSDEEKFSTIHDFSESKLEVEVKPEEEGQILEVKVEPIGVVEPKIELEYKVVLLDRKLSDYQTGETEKIFADATRIDISWEQANKSEHPFSKGGTLKCEGAGKVDIFTDEKCTQPSDGKLTPEQLGGDEKLSLWLRGKAVGKIEVSLALEDPKDRFIKVSEESHTQEILVAELLIDLHQYDESALGSEEFDAEQDTLDGYFTALKDKQIPNQKVLTDEQQVKSGRMLHVQTEGNHARAKLLLKKLSGDWPADADDYYIVVNQAGDSGALKIFDKESDGTLKATPHKIKVRDLKAEPVELWVEGEAATNKWRDIVLDVGLDREQGGVEKKEKRNGNWARFTVVQIKEVKLDYTPPHGGANAWDQTNSRFFINFLDDPDGRKINIAIELTEKLKDVPIYFMLAPHKDNGTAANWGVDLPATWKWKDIDADVKHKDRSGPKKLLHLSKVSDSNGKAVLELTLSRFGGDIFEPAAYIAQDPHLAKYVKDHGELSKRKPVVASHTISVWRKFWYHEVRVEGVNVQGFGNAADTYADVKAVMEAANPIDMARNVADGINPPVIYPKHMVSYYWDSNNRTYVNNYPNDNSDALVIGDNNESQFFNLVSNSADMPVKIPMINVHGLWIEDGISGSISTGWERSGSFPITLDMQKQLLDPPLQGGDLLAAGTWQARDWDPAANGGQGDWGNVRNGNLSARDIFLDPGRNDPETVKIRVPPGVVLAASGTEINIVNLSVRGGDNFLGTSYADGIVNCWTPNDQVDFINTINHEIGHSFAQVTTARPAGIPAHPHQYNKDGSHCRYVDNSCVMYESGPQAVHLDRYCPVCQPYVLVQNFRI